MSMSAPQCIVLVMCQVTFVSGVCRFPYRCQCTVRLIIGLIEGLLENALDKSLIYGTTTMSCNNFLKDPLFFELHQL